MICRAALACRRELETALPAICLHWQSVEKGEGNTSTLCRFPSYKLFEKELEFILLALRELRQESPFKKTTPFHCFFAETPCGWCLPPEAVTKCDTGPSGQPPDIAPGLLQADRGRQSSLCLSVYSLWWQVCLSGISLQNI